MTKKMLALLLALLMAGSTMAACGDAGSTETSTDTAAADTVPEETEPVYVKADLPERDFEGETFTFFGRIYEGAWSATDILAKEAVGEQINDAVYARTLYMEETYNLSLDVVESGETTVVNQLKKFITAGDDAYCAIVSDVYDAGAVAVGGMLHDLHNVEYIDLEQRWWSDMTNDSLSLGGKLYYATGDIFIIDNKATRVFFFNKDIVEDVGLENPYALVREGKWTLDTYMGMNEAAAADLNGDGEMDPDVDRYGTMVQPTLGGILYFAAGGKLTDKDADDMPYFACDTAEAIEILMGISETIANSPTINMTNDTTINGSEPDNIPRFMENLALFAPEVLKHIETMRESEVDIGILPPPKYNEAQEGYYCYADGWCVNVVSIPVTNINTDKIGFILEAMSADSLNNLTPAYYEVCLTDKYVRDQESVEMLDLILSSAVMDNANIFSWGGIESAINDALYKGTAIASVLASKKTSVETAIQKTMDGFLGQ
ncbi:MAG: extracellular solute-binding protein [Clostridia bacterium]|nr:extracellular solute-binding protein [Clostridia bacterium]